MKIIQVFNKAIEYLNKDLGSTSFLKSYFVSQ